MQKYWVMLSFFSLVGCVGPSAFERDYIISQQKNEEIAQELLENPTDDDEEAIKL
jgi:hypothetical protein